MNTIECTQGTPEWSEARIGLPTASRYGEIITPAKLTLSKQSEKYRNQLLAEYLLGHPIDWSGTSYWMERGTDLEPEARAFYEMQFDADVQQVGFILREDGWTGGSPDGLVGDDGGVEIKCPAIHTHIGYLLKPENLVDAYRCQVQGYMYLTDRQWWDMLSYHPDLPHVHVRVERDEAFIAALDKCLAQFIVDLKECREKLAPRRVPVEVAA